MAISFGVLLLLTVSVGLLAATSRRAHRLARQQMEFVAGVSHELRTPVAVIRSAAENLSHGVVGSGDRVKRYGQLLETEARRLGEMVERVLQYAGIESGLATGSRVPLAPTDIIEGAIESAITLFEPESVTIERDFIQDPPPVLGDAAALRSAVQNLIANAVKYGGRDRWVGIKIEHGRQRRRPEVWITVSDHGDGIPASELPHIFDPFYRGADAVRQFWQQWFSAWETIQFDYELIEAGERVVALLDMRMRGRSSGIEVPFGKFAWVARFRDGLLVHVKLYMRQREALEAAGAEP